MFKFISDLISILIICFISLTLNIFISICNSSEYKANIKSTDPNIRIQTIKSIGNKHEISEKEIDYLIDALNDKSDIVWLSAIRTIKKISPQGQLNISSLIKLLNDKSVKPEKKYYIIQILNLYKDKSDIFIDDLLKILKDNKTPAFNVVVSALLELAYSSSFVIASLLFGSNIDNDCHALKPIGSFALFFANVSKFEITRFDLLPSVPNKSIIWIFISTGVLLSFNIFNKSSMNISDLSLYRFKICII